MSNFDVSLFNSDCLEIINKIRFIHGAPPLLYSEELAMAAMEKASHISKIDSLAEDENLFNMSECLLRISGEEPVPECIIKCWEDEEKNFDFFENTFNPDCSAFTQMIWVNTIYFGLGIQELNGNAYIVARYRPAGNYYGLFEFNVFQKGTNMVQRTMPPCIPMATLPDNAKLNEYFENQHNKIRQKHHADDVYLVETLTRDALIMANNILNARLSNNPDPIVPEGYGMNVMVSAGGIPPPEEILKGWYRESEKYMFKEEDNPNLSGTFSQMVWKSSNLIGLGMVEKQHVCCCVCLYDPPGNIPGEYLSNVFEPIDDNKNLIDIFK